MVAALTGLIDALRTARLVVEVADRTIERAEDTRRQAHDVVTEHGFGSVQDAREALLDADTHRRLREQLDQRAHAELQARTVLEDTGADASADDEDVADLGTLAEALADAETAVADSARRLHLAEDRVGSLAGTSVRLEDAISAWAPLRDESLRAEAMARLVRGMGQDNQLQMRLSAYVLATRLDQVVAAANERLGHMRDQRYLLQRTDRVARKGSQAGLGLEVVDQWTGDARDPATLSGGETFVVSLSLALGLADVVTQEAGGTEIETLFVDEGFGTLDADTLDDVMDRLDGLRAGGRTVGVVSHVSELRNRIPTQVHVDKGRSGSTISVATLVG
jgi:exonuclease SbcC